MSFSMTSPPQYIDEVEIDSASDSAINLSWSVKGSGSHTASHITGFQVHFQKVASSYIQYSAMLSSMTTSYKIRNLVADTFYKVCVVMYRNETTQGGGGVGEAQPRQKCVDASTTGWHIPVSVGSSVGAIIALILIMLMVVIVRFPSIMRNRKGGTHTTSKYDSMTSNLHDDHLEMSDTTLHVHDDEEEEEVDDEEEIFDEEGQGEAAAAAVAFADPRGSIIVEVPVTFHEHLLKQQHHNCQSVLAESYCNGNNNKHSRRHRHLHHQRSISPPPPQPPPPPLPSPPPQPLPHHYVIRASTPHLHHIYHQQQQPEHHHQQQQQTQFVSPCLSHLSTEQQPFVLPLSYISEVDAGYHHIATGSVCPHKETSGSHTRKTHLKRQVSKGKYEGCPDQQPHCSHRHSTKVKIEHQPKNPRSKVEKQPSVDLSSPL